MGESILTVLITAIIEFVIIAILFGKIIVMRRSVNQICRDMSDSLTKDTNVVISIDSSDKKMRSLANALNKNLMEIRRLKLKYDSGDREIKTAVTNIAHDLRTPLTAIYGYLDLIKKEEKSERLSEYLSIISGRVDVMRDLAEELFRYSVIMSVEEYQDREDISLNAAIEDAIAAFYGAFINEGITPDIQMPEKSIVRSLNRKAITRIFTNIISNAVKYSDGDFRVVLDEAGTISFSNSSKSLDSIQAGKLFERFYTVENGRNQTGIGLSIAKTLTEEMGGNIHGYYENGQLIIELRFESTLNER